MVGLLGIKVGVSVVGAVGLSVEGEKVGYSVVGLVGLEVGAKEGEDVGAQVNLAKKRNSKAFDKQQISRNRK